MSLQLACVPKASEAIWAGAGSNDQGACPPSRITKAFSLVLLEFLLCGVLNLLSNVAVSQSDGNQQKVESSIHLLAGREVDDSAH